ncbi:MAG: hypothetical protein WC915_06555, partial [archaeon]
VGELFGGFTVKVLPAVPDYLNQKISIYFFDEQNNNVKTISNLALDSNGERVISTTDTQFKLDRIGKLRIVAIAGDPQTSPYKVTKEFNIQKTLELTFANCPISTFINRDFTCTWIAKDKSTGIEPSNIQYVRTIVPELQVKNPTTKSVTLNSPSIGSVKISVTANLDGYISASKYFETSVQDTTYSVQILIDNKDKTTYTTGVEQGSHLITVKVLESGIPASVSRLDFTVKTPTGQFVPLNFNCDSTSGTCTTTYNLADTGRNYMFGDTSEPESKGNVYLTDPYKTLPTVRFTLTTSGTKTEDLQGTTNNAIIYAVVIGVVILITIILFAIILKKRIKSSTGVSVGGQLPYIG